MLQTNVQSLSQGAHWIVLQERCHHCLPSWDSVGASHGCSRNMQPLFPALLDSSSLQAGLCSVLWFDSEHHQVFPWKHFRLWLDFPERFQLQNQQNLPLHLETPQLVHQYSSVLQVAQLVKGLLVKVLARYPQEHLCRLVKSSEIQVLGAYA